MNLNKVILEFDKSLTNLAGYDFGIITYKEQVEEKINLSTDFTIVFPEQIKGIAASFVQGFFAEIVNTIGLLETEKLVKIKARTEQLEKSVVAKLL